MSPVVLMCLLASTSFVVLLVIHQQSKKTLLKEVSQLKEDILKESRLNRSELSQNLQTVSETMSKRLIEMATMQNQQIHQFLSQIQQLTVSNQHGLEKLRETIEQKLTTLQDDNNKKLEQMRATVDEKLHATLEKRLGDSFKLVSDRLEQVHKGLGEMQNLATGVGDLKRVLTNVKTRGTWGEVQLETLLSQILSPEQFAKNVRVNPTQSELVEFVIKLPESCLPIDAKFPMDAYQALLDAQETADPKLVESEANKLETRIKLEAKRIKDKYICPPHTTDFSILYLPIEGLYAEVLRRQSLQETLQRDYRVIIAGPTTLAALLNSLQMGFRTLAIEKRSSEVWAILSAVKGEFLKFGEILEKTQKKLQEASNTIDQATTKTRTIERKLSKVEALPEAENTLPLIGNVG